MNLDDVALKAHLISSFEKLMSYEPPEEYSYNPLVSGLAGITNPKEFYAIRMRNKYVTQRLGHVLEKSMTFFDGFFPEETLADVLFRQGRYKYAIDIKSSWNTMNSAQQMGTKKKLSSYSKLGYKPLVLIFNCPSNKSLKSGKVPREAVSGFIDSMSRGTELYDTFLSVLHESATQCDMGLSLDQIREFYIYKGTKYRK